jgi:hypothetical protein
MLATRRRLFDAERQGIAAVALECAGADDPAALRRVILRRRAFSGK